MKEQLRRRAICSNHSQQLGFDRTIYTRNARWFCILRIPARKIIRQNGLFFFHKIPYSIFALVRDIPVLFHSVYDLPCFKIG